MNAGDVHTVADVNAYIAQEVAAQKQVALDEVQKKQDDSIEFLSSLDNSLTNRWSTLTGNSPNTIGGQAGAMISDPSQLYSVLPTTVVTAQKPTLSIMPIILGGVGIYFLFRKKGILHGIF